MALTKTLWHPSYIFDVRSSKLQAFDFKIGNFSRLLLDQCHIAFTAAAMWHLKRNKVSI